MKNLKSLLVLVFLLPFISCQQSSIVPDPTYVQLKVSSIERGESDVGSPCFSGYLENHGTKAAFDCNVLFTLYSDNSKTNIVDKAESWGDGLKQIEPGETGYFEAPYYKAAPQDVKSWDIEVTWKER